MRTFGPSESLTVFFSTDGVAVAETRTAACRLCVMSFARATGASGPACAVAGADGVRHSRGACSKGPPSVLGAGLDRLDDVMICEVPPVAATEHETARHGAPTPPPPRGELARRGIGATTAAHSARCMKRGRTDNVDDARCDRRVPPLSNNLLSERASDSVPRMHASRSLVQPVRSWLQLRFHRHRPNSLTARLRTPARSSATSSSSRAPRCTTRSGAAARGVDATSRYSFPRSATFPSRRLLWSAWGPCTSRTS